MSANGINIEYVDFLWVFVNVECPFTHNLLHKAYKEG